MEFNLKKITLKLISFLATSLFFIACQKKEPLYKKPVFGSGTVVQTISMGENYENQVFFDLSTDISVTSSPSEWDISFSYDVSNRIHINGGKDQDYMIANLGNVNINDSVNFSKITDAVWKYDNPNGNQDSSALGKIFTPKTSRLWEASNNVYLLRMGPKALGAKQYIKIKFVKREGTEFSFIWGYANNTSPYMCKVNTTPDKNAGYYSFSVGSQVQTEPIENNNWDLLFTTYKQPVKSDNGVFYDYVIRGVLSNPNGTLTTNLTGIVDYDKINLDYAKSCNFNNLTNNIGYDWKVFSIQANKYTIVRNNSYLIKNNKGNYFKLKFVDFYDEKDRKGYPKFAYELLK